jgi:mRNA interferase RelE/StbE
VAGYRVVFARSARRELEALEAGVGRRIISRVEALTTDPRPRGCVKLQGAADLWRIRIGDYRVVYAIDCSGARAGSGSMSDPRSKLVMVNTAVHKPGLALQEMGALWSALVHQLGGDRP